MFSLIQRRLIWCLFLGLLAGGPLAHADKIYLKDGTIQESDQVWISSAYVHFILNGTQSVEIRYAKEIVASVQIDGVEEPIGAKAPKTSPTTKPSEAPTRKNDDSGNRDGNPGPPMQYVSLDRKLKKNNRGLEFYAPRREQRYWAAKNSRHATLNSALNALSEIYGRSSAWIERYMGSENDLGAIHRSLISQRERESGHADPPDSKSPPAQAQPQPPLNTQKTLGDDLERVPKGLEFYKPRRKEKYWTGDDGRYNSLNDAVRALAKQYGVNEEWIDRHMGNTNDLTKIHQNIQNSLKNKE